MKKITLIIVALIAMFVGVGGILPALAKVRDLGAIPGPFVGSYTLGVFLVTLVGTCTICTFFRRRTTTPGV
jgi:hypothetical protein